MDIYTPIWSFLNRKKWLLADGLDNKYGKGICVAGIGIPHIKISKSLFMVNTKLTI